MDGPVHGLSAGGRGGCEGVLYVHLHLVRPGQIILLLTVFVEFFELS